MLTARLRDFVSLIATRTATLLLTATAQAQTPTPLPEFGLQLTTTRGCLENGDNAVHVEGDVINVSALDTCSIQVVPASGATPTRTRSMTATATPTPTATP